MKTLFITISVLLIFTTGIQAQKDYYEEKAFIDTGTGGENRVSNPSKNTMAGFLLNEKSDAASIQLRYQHFLTKHWGVFISSQFSWTESRDKDDFLYSGLQPDGRKYYMLNLKEDGHILNSFQTHLVGGQFRLDNRYFSIRPYFGAGVHLLESTGYQFDLKEKGTNQAYHAVSGFDGKMKASFCISPGLNLVWKAFKRIYFYADVSYVHSIGKVEARQEFTDLYTGKVVGVEKDKSSLPGIVSIKFGLSAPLWFIR